MTSKLHEEWKDRKCISVMDAVDHPFYGAGVVNDILDEGLLSTCLVSFMESGRQVVFKKRLTKIISGGSKFYVPEPGELR